MTAHRQHSTLHRQVFESVASSLMRGDFRPGDQLTIRQIAARVGTSTMPVREAVRRLAALGAIEVHPRKSLCVPAIDIDSFVEVAEMRKLLEGRAAFLACERATKQGIDSVCAVHTQLIGAGRAASPSRLMRLNHKFHFGVYRLADSELLLETITQLWLRAGPHLSHVLDQRPEHSNMVENFSEHEALVEALVSRDSQGAVAAIMADIEVGTALFIESVRASERADISLLRLPRSAARHKRALVRANMDSTARVSAIARVRELPLA